MSRAGLEPATLCLKGRENGFGRVTIVCDRLRQNPSIEHFVTSGRAASLRCFDTSFDWGYPHKSPHSSMPVRTQPSKVKYKGLLRAWGSLIILPLSVGQ
jgi:hypothetical protein